MSHPALCAATERARLLLCVIPALILLLLVVLGVGTASKLSARLLQYGEKQWTGYASLRSGVTEPDCDIAAARAGMAAADAPQPAPPPPKPKPAEGSDDDDLDEIDLDDLMGEEPPPSAAAMRASFETCVVRWDAYDAKNALLKDPSIARYMKVEMGLEAVALKISGVQKHMLVLLILLCALSTTLVRGHIALRSPRSALEGKLSEGGQLFAHLLLLGSFYAMWRTNVGAGVVIENVELFYLWMGGLGVLSAVNIARLLRPSPAALAAPAPGLSKALLAVPLYVSMAGIAGAYFFLAEGNAPGLAVFVSQLTENAGLYLQVGLYVWSGMLLKQLYLSRYLLDVVRPWKFPPELLVFVLVAAAALPTAYSGASGIFVIAVGGLVYRELREAGARQQLALAATAMSGSLGVVLRPCLLVVIVSMLNKDVTTDDLFGWGKWIFLLTATLLLIACVIMAALRPPTPAGQPRWMASPAVALPESIRRLWPLLSYGVLGALVLLFYTFALDMAFDEREAAVILPPLLLALLVLDRKRKHTHIAAAAPELSEEFSADATPRRGIGASIMDATSETTEHVGALLMLMGLSVCLGGVVERGELMSLMPDSFGSPMLAMVAMVVMLVFIGMVMDPYGAVILVNASLVKVAVDQGISPVHFWLVVLTAFELGYLTPPVALNHLLTRQVIGEQADIDDLPPDAPFWMRHERILLPLVIVAIALFVVAFVPFAFY